MGASDSKLVFKQGIFKLSENTVPPQDPFWNAFWELPESAEDVFSLFTSSDIRRVRDESRKNLETLITVLCARLQYLRNHPHFPSPEAYPERHALNCVRVLTRLLPYIYEAEHLDDWEHELFWKSREASDRQTRAQTEVLFDGQQDDTPRHDSSGPAQDLKPMGEELIDCLLDLLYFTDFTIPHTSTAQNGGKVRLSIWQSGVGCNNPVGSTKELEANRMEILRLLLTMASKSMYTSANLLPVQGVPAITYMTTLSDKTLVLTVLCSLLNTTLKYNPAAWRVPYDHVVMKDPKQVFVTHCLQLLLVLVLYPVPEAETSSAPRNAFRHFLGKLHRPQDFQFLVDGMTRILNQPLQVTSSYLPGSFKSLAWAPEMIMLFWEVLQCNKRFRSFIVDTDRAHDFLVLVLFYALEHRNDASKQGIVRMCIFVLQTLSVEPTFASRLNKLFRGQETLPPVMRIANFHGTYADFLIISIHALIMTTNKMRLEAIYPALLAILNNVAPHVTDLGGMASSKLMQLFATMSKPEFLFANESNHALLRSLLEVLNAILEHEYDHNATFVYAILRSHRRFQALREMVVSGARDELSQYAQRRKEAADRPESQSREASLDYMRRPTAIRSPSIASIPEQTADAFAIGDDDEDEDAMSPSTLRGDASLETSTASLDNSQHESAAESAHDAVPSQTRAMSEKARGKLPAGKTFSRHGSTASLASLALGLTIPNAHFEPSEAWAQSWLHELPMHTALTIIDQLMPLLPTQTASSTSSQAIHLIRTTELSGLEVTPVRIQLFEWTPLSLGWYESLLWGLVFSGEVDVSKGAPSVWKGTSVKLFRVQETAAQGPTLMSPRGAVDAVGSNLVSRFGSLSLGGGSGQGGVAAGTLANSGSNSGGVIRDV